MGAFHCCADDGRRAVGKDALVKAHNDVGADAVLVLNGRLRREKMPAAVNVRLKSDAVIADPAQRPHTERLIAAAVGKDGAVPPHKAMQPAGVPHPRHAGTQV